MVVTLFGKAFARTGKDTVIAAAKLITSVILTRKHIAINIDPSGMWSKMLKESKTILKCQVESFFFLLFNSTH